MLQQKSVMQEGQRQVNNEIVIASKNYWPPFIGGFFI